jgi:hypothetical protein
MISLSSTIRAFIAGGIATLALPAVAQASTVYQDNFTGSGTLNNTHPSTDTNGNVWTTFADFNVTDCYVENGSSVSEINTGGSPVDGNAYLPVNGTSGVTLDGSQNFTLSAIITAPTAASASTPWMGIYLATSTPSGGSQYEANGANNAGLPWSAGALAIRNSYPDYVASDANNNYVESYSTPVRGNPETLSIEYNASAGTLSYYITDLGAAPIASYSVSPSQIASIEYVGFGNGAYGNDPATTLADFTLTVSGSSTPEPATAGLLTLGCTALLTRRRMRRHGLA